VEAAGVEAGVLAAGAVVLVLDAADGGAACLGFGFASEAGDGGSSSVIVTLTATAGPTLTARTMSSRDVGRSR
jgi:hypothetical protein